MSLKKWTLSFGFLFVFIATGASAAQSSAAVPGTAAPAFSLPSANGKTVKLTDFKGKYVVLEWLNHGCPYVKKHYETSNMQTLQKEFTAKNTIWLSIISSAPGQQGHSTPEQALKDAEQKGASPTAILLDADGAVGKLYGAKVTPHMFVIGPDSKILYNGAIDDKDSTQHSTVKEAQNYVRKALEEAMTKHPITVASTKPYGCNVKYK